MTHAWIQKITDLLEISGYARAADHLDRMGYTDAAECARMEIARIRSKNKQIC
jgi:hypothetical protein